MATVSINDSFVDVSVDECIKRDLARLKSVGEKVIRKMHKHFLASKPPTIRHDIRLQDAIIVDMDGTLALLNGRSPYDPSTCIRDLPNEPVVETVKLWQKECHVIACSGRNDDSLDKTKAWLVANGIHAAALHMRKTGEKQKDSALKKGFYKDHVEGKYNVNFVIDDRQQVVDIWRSLGLTVFQVAEGDF